LSLLFSELVGIVEIFSLAYCQIKKTLYICNPKRKQLLTDEVARTQGETEGKTSTFFNIL